MPNFEIKPNILIILADDLGYSDIGCYGGEIKTPNLDKLAENGLRFTQFYNVARCCPSRASLLTGLYPHQTGVGHMMEDLGLEGYRGDLNRHCVTIAEVLKRFGYRTYMSGKWHLTRFLEEPKHNWPCQRGFDRFYGIITGASSYFQPTTLTRDNTPIEAVGKDYYITDAISDEMCNFLIEHEEKYPDSPFFAYLSYTAPHWPLHAPEEDIQRYEGLYDVGWDVIRERRYKRLIDLGIIKKYWGLSPRDPAAPDWDKVKEKIWQARRMEVYAAQVDRMDQGIGRIIQTLKEIRQLDDTLIIFLSDNGACAEEIRRHDVKWMLKDRIAVTKTREGRKVIFGNNPEIMPGGEDTYQSYGLPWANVSNTPFREYKHWVHEGGIATPFIVHWPRGIKARGELRHQPGQLPDIMATILDVTGATYPSEFAGYKIHPLEGFSLKPIFENKPNGRELLYFEHEGNRAVRRAKWKLVCKYPRSWELYNMEKDRTELNDLSTKHPEIVSELSKEYDEWAKRCKVLPWDKVLARMRR